MRDIIIYDIETVRGPDEVPGGWSNPWGMGMASAVAYSLSKNTFHLFLHEESRCQLLEMLNGNLAVGFNSIRFDSRVLLGNGRSLDMDFGRATTNMVDGKSYCFFNYDVMIEFIMTRYSERKWDQKSLEAWLDDPRNHGSGVFSLNSICKKTLGRGKTGHGAHAPDLYAKGKWGDLLSYNLHDVRLTVDLMRRVMHEDPISGGDGIEVMLPPPHWRKGDEHVYCKKDLYLPQTGAIFQSGAFYPVLKKDKKVCVLGSNIGDHFMDIPSLGEYFAVKNIITRDCGGAT